MNFFSIYVLNFTINLLIEAKNVGKTASYSGLSYILTGRKSIFILNTIIAIYLDGAILIYFIILGDIVPKLFLDFNSTKNTILSGKLKFKKNKRD